MGSPNRKTDGMNDFRAWIENKLGQRVRFNEPMSAHTSFRTGGPADIFCLPASVEEAVAVVQKTRSANLPLLITGGGTNLLVRDNGIRGVVLSLKGIRQKIRMTPAGEEEALLTVCAGTRTPVLCAFAIKHALNGMNFALGIPGTVGGAVMMNAGTRFGAMDAVVDKITLLGGDGEKRTLAGSALTFSYRKLVLPEEAFGEFDPLILEVSFRLAKGERKEIIDDSKRIIAFRKKSQPTPFPSAGCFFKNPPAGEPAGKLIDLAGLKGLTKGDAAVSRRHANFIVNRGAASADDILELMETIRARVFADFNVELSPEVRIVGA